MNALGARLSALLLTCLLVACAGGASRGSTAEQAAYSEALRTASNDPRAGAEALSGFLKSYPRSALADDAALLLADLAIRLEKPDAAVRQLEWVLREHPNGDQADRARLTLAKLQRERGASPTARSTALRIRLVNLTPPEQHEARRLLADLAAEAKDPTDRLRWLGELAADPGPGPEDEAVDDEIDEVIAALPDDLLDRVAAALGRRPIAARVRLAQAERALQAGDRKAAERALGFAKRLPLAPGDADTLVRLETRQTAKPDDRVLALVSTPRPFEDVPADPFVSTGGLGTTLGVVLPLTGSVGGYGADALAGIQLAAGVSEGEPGYRRGPRLVVRDSGGSPGAAADAVRELAADPRVLAVLGPLLPEEAEAAAQAATETGVPLVTLSRREGLAVGKPGVLRAGTSPRLEAELLAEHAIREVGQSRFAILYPEDAFGRALRAAFWDAVEARGGEVVAVGRYPVGASDFAAPIRRMIGFELLPPGAPQVLAERERMLKRAKRLPAEEAKELREEAAELTAPDGEPLPPYVDFEAVFIPDTYQAAGLLAPHLAFHEVRGVSLLGPSAWNHPGLLELGGRHLEGAVFPAAYHAAVLAPNVVTFGERYEESYERAPSSLAAEAFDAANLVLAAAAAGVDDRDALLEALFREPRSAGVSGALEIGPEGEVARRPHLLGVSRGEVVSLDEREFPPVGEDGADASGAPPESD